MRPGCGGCLSTLTVLAVGVGVAALGTWFLVGVFSEPALGTTVPSPDDRHRVESKLDSLLGGQVRGRQIVLSEAEVSALLNRHVPDAIGVPVLRVMARLPAPDTGMVGVLTPVRTVLREVAPVALDYLPGRWAARPVWLVVLVTPSVETAGSRRSLRLTIQEFRIGTRRLPAAVIGLIVDPGALSVLSWPLPAVIEGVTIERARVIVRGASSPSRNEPGARR